MTHLQPSAVQDGYHIGFNSTIERAVVSLRLRPKTKLETGVEP
jgi:hypothetical protein